MSLGYLNLALLLLTCLVGSYSIWAYAITLKARLNILSGPAPPLHLGEKVQERLDKQRNLAARMNNLGSTITGCIGVFALLWYFFDVPDGYSEWVGYLFYWVLAMTACRILLGAYAKSSCKAAEESNQDLTALTIAENLHDHGDERRVVSLKVNSQTAQPPTPEELAILLPSLARALTEAPPTQNQPVLVLWKRQNGEVTAWASTVKGVTAAGPVSGEAVRAFTSITSGIKPPYRIRANDRDFLGGAIALYLEDPDANSHLGWIATKECAHILLASLPWLSSIEKELIYQLINPGKEFPHKRQE